MGGVNGRCMPTTTLLLGGRFLRPSKTKALGSDPGRPRHVPQSAHRSIDRPTADWKRVWDRARKHPPSIQPTPHTTPHDTPHQTHPYLAVSVQLEGQLLVQVLLQVRPARLRHGSLLLAACCLLLLAPGSLGWCCIGCRLPIHAHATNMPAAAAALAVLALSPPSWSWLWLSVVVSVVGVVSVSSSPSIPDRGGLTALASSRVRICRVAAIE